MDLSAMHLVMLAAAAEGEHAAAAGGGINVLNVNWVTFLGQALNVLVVMYLLYRFLFRPLGAVLAKRETDVAQWLDGARKDREEAARQRQEMEQALEETRRRSQEELQRAIVLAEEERQRRVKLAEEEALRTLERARQEIHHEREQAVAAIREEAANLAVLAAGRLLERNITGEDHRRMAKEFIQQVGERN